MLDKINTIVSKFFPKSKPLIIHYPATKLKKVAFIQGCDSIEIFIDISFKADTNKVICLVLRELCSLNNHDPKGRLAEFKRVGLLLPYADPTANKELQELIDKI